MLLSYLKYSFLLFKIWGVNKLLLGVPYYIVEHLIIDNTLKFVYRGGKMIVLGIGSGIYYIAFPQPIEITNINEKQIYNNENINLDINDNKYKIHNINKLNYYIINDNKNTYLDDNKIIKYNNELNENTYLDDNKNTYLDDNKNTYLDDNKNIKYNNELNENIYLNDTVNSNIDYSLLEKN